MNRVVAPDEVLARRWTWAAALAAGPLVAHGLAKGAIDGGLEGTLADGLPESKKLRPPWPAPRTPAAGIASFAEHGPGQATFVGR